MPHADPGGVSRAGLDAGSADRARSGFVSGFGAARWPAGHTGMAEFLLQVADDRAEVVSGARPLHPTHEAQKYIALDDGRRPNHPSGPGILRLVKPHVGTGLQPAVR